MPPDAQSTLRDDSLNSILTRPRRLVLLWIVAAVLYTLVVPTGVIPRKSAILVTDLAWTIAALLATVSCLRAARASRGRERTAWSLFTWSCGAWTAGQLAWDTYEILLDFEVPFPSLADVGYMAFGPLMIVGLLVLRTTQSERRLTWLRIANLGLILCGLAVVLIAMLTQPFTRVQLSTGGALIIIVESASIAIAFLVALYVLWSYPWDDRLAPVALVTGSLLVQMIAWLFYTRDLITEDFGVRSAYNALWILAFGVMQWAGESQVSTRRAIDSSQTRAMSERHGWVEAVTPAVLLLCMAATAIALSQEITPQVVHFGSVMLAVFAIVLAVREALLHGHGMQVRDLLSRASSALELSRTQLAQVDTHRRDLQREIELMARAGGVGLWDWDLRANTVRYTREWKRQLGYEEHEITDDVEEWRTRLHPEDTARVVGLLETFLQNPVGEFVAEQRLLHRDGTYRWILSQGSMLCDDSGHPQRLLGSHVDITSSKHMEFSLRESEANNRELVESLETRVSERTRELTNAYRESQNFAYAVAHDLKAPLRAIDGFSHLLEQSAGERLSTDERGYIRRVRNGAMHMAALIDGLLAYSRLEHSDMRSQDVIVRDLAHEVLQSMGEAVRAKHADVNMTLPPKMTVVADREGLRLILRNLLDNALKFTSPTRSPRVEIGGYPQAECFVMTIRDNGIGFDPQYHAKIFDIFNRLHASGYEGTGIGLALVRKAVQRMRGSVWAESELDHGATFYVRLPIAASQDAQRGDNVDEVTK